MCSAVALGKDGGGGGLDGDNLHVGVLRFKELASAGQRPASANARDEDINLAVGVFPDLGTGGCLVCGGVGGVGELTGNERVLDFGMQLIGFLDGAAHALRSVGQNQLGSVCLHELAALDGHGLGHHDDDAHAAGGGKRGQADAGVSGRGLDQDGVFVDLACCLRAVKESFRDAVLDGACGIHHLYLAEDGCVQAVVLLEVRKFKQRGVSDKLVNAFADGHGFAPSSFTLPRGRQDPFRYSR